MRLFAVPVLPLALLTGCGARSEALFGFPGTPTGTGVSSSSSSASASSARTEGSVTGIFGTGVGSATAPSASSSGTTSVAVLFGGWVPNLTFDDTWIWDGTGWTQAMVPGPPAREEASMASLGGVAVLFGGVSTPTVYGDTWIWDGAMWAQASTPIAPPASSDGAMAAAGSSLVLVPGELASADGGAGPSLETWLWNGATWSQAILPPPGLQGRQAAAMATLNGDPLLAGGFGRSPTEPLDELLEWTGSSWRRLSSMQLSNAGLVQRVGASMATLDGVVVLFGGYGPPVDGGAIGSETWTGKATSGLAADWTLAATTGPSARSYAAMATVGSKVVLFGGIDANANVLGDTWTWDGASWTEQKVMGPHPRVAASMTGL